MSVSEDNNNILVDGLTMAINKMCGGNDLNSSGGSSVSAKSGKEEEDNNKRVVTVTKESDKEIPSKTATVEIEMKSDSRDEPQENGLNAEKGNENNESRKESRKLFNMGFFRLFRKKVNEWNSLMMSQRVVRYFLFVLRIKVYRAVNFIESFGSVRLKNRFDSLRVHFF